MERNKVENEIREKLLNREIKPSDDSWSKLNAMLPEVPKKPGTSKKWFWLAAAAIIAVLFTIRNINIGSTSGIPSDEVPVVESKSYESTTPLKEITEDVKTEEDALAADLIGENKIEVRPDRETISNSVEEVVVIDNLKEDETAAPLKSGTAINELPINDKDAITAVYEEAKRIQEIEGEVTEEAIDELILMAQRKLKLTKTLKNNNTSDAAMALLQDVEEELDETFRDKVFELLKQGMVKVKTAVVDRNQ